MTAAFLVRDARPDDLDAVVALLHEDVIREVDEAEVPASAYAPAFAEILADDHQQLLVGEAATDGGSDVVATAQLSWLRRMTYVGGLFCVVESVRVRSDLRARGYGAALMREVERLARERGAARIELTTNAQRDRARLADRFHVDRVALRELGTVSAQRIVSVLERLDRRDLRVRFRPRQRFQAHLLRWWCAHHPNVSIGWFSGASRPGRLGLGGSACHRRTTGTARYGVRP